MMPENLEELVKKEEFGYAGKSGNVLYLADRASLLDAAWLLVEEPKYVESLKNSIPYGNQVYMFFSVDTKSGEVCAEGVGTSVDDFKTGKYYSKTQSGEKSDSMMSDPALKLKLGKKFEGEIFF
jgi:uncharacterized protein YbaA (DUF1428 family)